MKISDLKTNTQHPLNLEISHLVNDFLYNSWMNDKPKNFQTFEIFVMNNITRRNIYFKTKKAVTISDFLIKNNIKPHTFKQLLKKSWLRWYDDYTDEREI